MRSRASLRGRIRETEWDGWYMNIKYVSVVINSAELNNTQLELGGCVGSGKTDNNILDLGADKQSPERVCIHTYYVCVLYISS